MGFGAIAPDVVDRTSNRFGFIPAVPGLLTGGSADDAEQKLTPEIDCFRFCPYTRDSTETTQHLGGLGNRIFNLIDLGERRGRKWQGRAALRLPDKPERVRLFDRLPRAARPAAGITELGPPARLPVSNHIQVNLSRDQSGCGHEANSGTRDGRGRLSGDGVSRVRHG